MVWWDSMFFFKPQHIFLVSRSYLLFKSISCSEKTGTPLFVGWNRPVYIWQECTTLNLWNQSRLEVAQRMLSAFGSKKKTIHPCFFQNFKLHHLKVRSCSLIFWWTELCWFKKESLKQVTRFLRSIRYLIGMGGRSEVVNGSPNKIGEMIPLELTSFLEDSLGDVLIFSILSILSSMKLYYCALNLPPTQ